MERSGGEESVVVRRRWEDDHCWEEEEGRGDRSGDRVVVPGAMFRGAFREEEVGLEDLVDRFGNEVPAILEAEVAEGGWGIWGEDEAVRIWATCA